MTVTLQTFDLVQPAGELDGAWFPDNDLGVLVSGALALVRPRVEANAAIAAVNHNAAAAASVYARLYRLTASRLAASPQTLTIGGQITRVTSADRVTYFEKLAAAKESEYASYAQSDAHLDAPNRSQRARVTASW